MSRALSSLECESFSKMVDSLKGDDMKNALFLKNFFYVLSLLALFMNVECKRMLFIYIFDF
jgi:hypothetical protein